MRPVQSAEEYRVLVEGLSFLTENAFQEVQYDLERGFARLPMLMSLVNTIGYLRGQHGMFFEVRPRTDFQNELYENERHFERRLEELIAKLSGIGKEAEMRQLLESYYVENRIG